MVPFKFKPQLGQLWALTDLADTLFEYGQLNAVVALDVKACGRLKQSSSDLPEWAVKQSIMPHCDMLVA